MIRGRFMSTRDRLCARNASRMREERKRRAPSIASPDWSRLVPISPDQCRTDRALLHRVITNCYRRSARVTDSNLLQFPASSFPFCLSTPLTTISRELSHSSQLVPTCFTHATFDRSRTRQYDFYPILFFTTKRTRSYARICDSIKV